MERIGSEARIDRRSLLERGLSRLPELVAPDRQEYRPWIIQRGRSRPALLLNLRRYDPRSGLLIGWQASYPHLVAADYVGERMVMLGFGTRHFVIEGNELGKLIHHLQQGTVLAVQEYSATVWPNNPAGPVVTQIVKIEAEDSST